jgi:hypothetical protein
MKNRTSKINKFFLILFILYIFFKNNLILIANINLLRRLINLEKKYPWTTFTSSVVVFTSLRALYNRKEVDKDKPYIDTIKEVFQKDFYNTKRIFNKLFSNSIENNTELDEKENKKTETEKIKEKIEEEKENNKNKYNNLEKEKIYDFKHYN